jgi:hypothetical protein
VSFEKNGHGQFVTIFHSISNTTEGLGPVKNMIAKAIVERIIMAARDGTKFKVFPPFDDITRRALTFVHPSGRRCDSRSSWFRRKYQR